MKILPFFPVSQMNCGDFYEKAGAWNTLLAHEATLRRKDIREVKVKITEKTKQLIKMLNQ